MTERIPASAPPAGPSRGLLRLLRSDLFKLWHRPLTWGLIAVSLFFVLAAFLTLIYTVLNHASAVLPGHLFGGSVGLGNIIIQQLTLGRRVGEFSCVALAGAAVGVDFSSGALRVVLGRGVARWQVLLSKYLALCVFAVFLALLMTLEAALLAGFLPVLVGGAPGLDLLSAGDLGSILRADLGLLENWVGVMALGVALAIVGRSAAVGVGGGLAYLIAEDLGGRVLPAITFETHVAVFRELTSILYSANLSAFFYHSIPIRLAAELDFLDGVMPTPMVGTAHSLIVAAAFLAALLLISGALFARQERGS